MIFALSACGSDNPVFKATVLENDGTGTLLVEPDSDTNESKSADKIAVHTNNAKILSTENKEIEISEIKERQKVEITHKGQIAESYPAQIWAIKIKVIE